MYVSAKFGRHGKSVQRMGGQCTNLACPGHLYEFGKRLRLYEFDWAYHSAGLHSALQLGKFVVDTLTWLPVFDNSHISVEFVV